MNTRIEAALMISTGALLSAGAHFGPALGERFIDAITPSEQIAATQTAPPAWLSEPSGLRDELRLRVMPCQDLVAPLASTNNATMTSRDDRGGFTVSIVDGELNKIEAEGDYTLEEKGDTVRILDPDGDITFETSRSNPSLGIENFGRHTFDNPLLAMVAPGAPGTTATLGAQLSPVDEAMAAQLGIETGVVVEFVIPGSGADAGGLQQYDVIVAMGGDPVDSALLSEIITALQPGDSVELGLIRSGERQTIEIELGAAPRKAPRINGLRFNNGNLDELHEMQRLLKLQGQQPRRLLPATPRSPDAIDASDMAPKHNSHSFPA